MKNKNILDLPLIQKTIHSKHGKFIKDFGTTYEKIIADRELFLNMAAARINWNITNDLPYIWPV